MIEQNQGSHLPRRVTVTEVLRSRYSPGQRPLSWDERHPGIEEVVVDSGERLALFSNGGQSSPAVGWELLLTKTVASEELDAASRAQLLESLPVLWTLYAIPPKK